MTRRPTRTIMATWFAMLSLQTIGSIDAKHKLPAPRQYVAISVVWGILFLLVDTGLGKAAARFSVLLLLTGTVLGPFGKRLVSFLNAISQRFAISPSAGGSAFTPAPAPAELPGRGAQIA